MRSRGADDDDHADADADVGDLDLAVGFLFAEGVIDGVIDLDSVAHCAIAPSPDAEGNVVQARLRPGLGVDWARLRRHTFSSSSCGVCGKASIEAIVGERAAPSASATSVSTSTITLAEAQGMLEVASHAQPLFAQSGGCHGAAAVALNAGQATVVVAREDVGRHNAVDKVIGALLRAGVRPHSDEARGLTLTLSGRVAFELVQKAARFGFTRIVAKGAPSSLAVELARAASIELIAFVKPTSANHYP